MSCPRNGQGGGGCPATGRQGLLVGWVGQGLRETLGRQANTASDLLPARSLRVPAKVRDRSEDSCRLGQAHRPRRSAQACAGSNDPHTTIFPEMRAQRWLRSDACLEWSAPERGRVGAAAQQRATAWQSVGWIWRADFTGPVQLRNRSCAGRVQHKQAGACL